MKIQSLTPATIRGLMALGLTAACAVPFAISTGTAKAQVPPPPPVVFLPVPLNTVPVPLPTDLDLYIKDRAAAIRLGKALFWDMQVGSDGITACASCHYQAGADGRDKNQLAQGRDRSWDSGHVLNQQLTTTTRFPFTKFTDVNDPLSAKPWNYNDIVGSQGVFSMSFNGITNTAVDSGTVRPGGAFSSGGINTRQVTGRNAPSVINAIFNDRNFWDGRAHNEFNGVNPFGNSDINARVYENVDAVTGQATPIRIAIGNASLASQAVGPVNSDVEMAHGGRDFAAVGKKLLGLQPLGQQRVSTTDSVLGALANPTGNGLTTTYAALVEAAFQPKWINGVNKFTVSGGRIVPSQSGIYNHMEANFSLIFGLSVLMYESTLVSDNTPFDSFLAGNTAAMSASARRGYDQFIGQANCVVCHAGGPLSNATIPVLKADAAFLGIGVFAEIMPMRDLLPSAYDIGYYNVGTRPTAEDIGIGANDPFGNPLSYSRGLQLGIIQDPIRPIGQVITPTTRLAINGAFKVPGLRNVALTAPYNHTGGYSTLHQAINLYNRGFDHDNGVNLSPDVAVNPQLSVAQKQDLVQLMLEMTDPRVENRSAPFDHPELRIPNGHPNAAGSTTRVINRGDGNATDTMFTIPATGRTGGAKLRRFLGFTETRINTF